MRRLVVLPFAEQDLEEAWEYIAADDLGAAERVLERTYEVMLMLTAHPSTGRARSDLGPGLRTFPAGSYVIYYREAPGSVEIVRVLHGRRDAESIAFT